MQFCHSFSPTRNCWKIQLYAVLNVVHRFMYMQFGVLYRNNSKWHNQSQIRRPTVNSQHLDHIHKCNCSGFKCVCSQRSREHNCKHDALELKQLRVWCYITCRITDSLRHTKIKTLLQQLHRAFVLLYPPAVQVYPPSLSMHTVPLGKMLELEHSLMFSQTLKSNIQNIQWVKSTAEYMRNH